MRDTTLCSFNGATEIMLTSLLFQSYQDVERMERRTKEAVKNGMEAIEAWIEDAMKDGAPLPEPKVAA